MNNDIVLPAWITNDDLEFLKLNCENFDFVESARELSQSSIAKVVRKAGSKPLFFKKSSVKLLQAKSPRNPDAKWRVTQRSFVNEHAFLADLKLQKSLRDIGVFVPLVIAIERSSDANDFAAVFRTVTEFLEIGSAYIERKTFDDINETPRLFTWLARFHAFFWGQEKQALRSQFMEVGGWWRKQLRPTVKWDALVPTFVHLKDNFPQEFATLDLDKAVPLLSTMQEYAKQDKFLRALGPPRTLIHGDVKTCNFFLNASNSDVMAIDFQWIGACSSGFADIVYFFYGGVTSFPHEDSPETIPMFFNRMKEIENRLRDHYVREFLLAAQSKVSLEPQEIAAQYDLELLEYFTTAVPYLLSDLTPKLAKKNFNKYGYLTYEFDPRMTAFFFIRALEALEAQKHVLSRL